MHDNSLRLMQRFVAKYLNHEFDHNIADVGSYDVNGTYRPLFKRHNWKYTGFDIMGGPNVDIVLTPNYEWQLDASHIQAYDVVISGQTMEHVRMPWRWIQDVVRLVPPMGTICLIVPNTEVFHEHPEDCWRVWPDGMRGLTEDAGLEEIECYAHGPDTFGVFRRPD